MFNFLDGFVPRLWRSRDEAPPPETSATPTVAADATPRPLSSQMSAPSDGMSSSSSRHAEEPVAPPSVSSPPTESLTHNAGADRDVSVAPATLAPAPSPISALSDGTSISSYLPMKYVFSLHLEPSSVKPVTDRFDAATPATPATPRPPSPQIAELFGAMEISSSNPPPQSSEQVAGSSVLSSSQQGSDEDVDATIERDAPEHARSTSHGTVLRRKGRMVAFKFAPSRPRKEKKKKPKKKKKQEKGPSPSMVDLQQRLKELELKRDALLELSASLGTTPMSPPYEVDALDVAQHSFPGAARSKRKDHKSAPYRGGRKPKVRMEVKLPDPPFQDELQPYSPTRLPALCLRYRPPTPFRPAGDLPTDDAEEENSSLSQPSTPPPAEPRGLCLFDLGSRAPVRRPTLEKIDIPPTATPAVDPPQGDLGAAQAFLDSNFPGVRGLNPNLESGSPAYLTTPAGSTPELCADSRREVTPVESPFPKTPVEESGGFDGRVAVSSAYTEACYDVFGRPDEDRDDFGPSPRRRSGKVATAESAAASVALTPPAPALALAETVVVSDIPAQLSSAPSPIVPAVASQREMSWTTLPISSLPAAPQPFQLQPQSTYTQPSVVWGQAVQHQAQSPSSWQQSPFSAPSSTSIWMVPPAPTPSSFLTQSTSSFSQPIAIPQLPSLVQHVAPPLVLLSEADTSMDVDPFVSASSAGSARQRHRPIRDYRRAARQLLRVAAVQPGLDLRKRAARRMLRHLFAIRRRPITVNAFQGDRAVRKSLAVQRRNRKALRSARRSVRQALRRDGPSRAARPSRASPQSAPRLIQRTMSIEMAVEDSSSSRTPIECTHDVDVDMDGGNLPAILTIPTVPTVEVVDETMASEDVFQTQSPVPQMLADEPAQLPVEPSVPIPTIVVTPDTPLPEPQLQKELRASPEPSASAASLLSESFVPRPVMIMPSDSGKPKTKTKTASPLRQESSLAEFEVPLTKTAAPADVQHDPAPAPAPVVVAVLTPAAVYQAVVAAQSESESLVPETEPLVTETETEQQLVESDAGEETDDETEWEPVPVPAIAAVSPATPAAEAAPVEESTSPAETETGAETAPVEQEPPADDDAPVDVPLPNIAGEGPEIFLSSNESDSEDDEDDDDVVSLGASEDERERRLFYGEEYADEGEDDEDDEDYEDDGAEDDEQAEEGTEEGETEEEEDDDEESNEYDESAPINGPVMRPSAPASALPNSSPVPTPASAPAAILKGPESLSMPVPAPNVLPPPSVPIGGLTGGPYIGTVGEGYNESAGYRYSNNLLSNAANVSSGNALNGEAGLQVREAARRRNYENQVRQRNRAQDIIQSITAKSALLEELPSPVLPETTTSDTSDGAATIVVDQDVPESHPPSRDLGMTENPEEVLMSPDEDAENNAPRLDKGKGKATDEDVLLADRVTVPYLDPSSKTIADGMGLSPAEVQLNIDAFPKTDSKGEAPLSSECRYNCLLNGPSSGHTLACQRARGVFTTPLVVPKSSSSHSGSGHSASPSPAEVLAAPASDQHAKPSVIGVSPQDERPPQSVLKTEVNTAPIDQGTLESTQLFIGLPTTPLPTTHEQQLPITEFLEDGMDQQFTNPAKAWVDLFANPIQAATTEGSLPEANTQQPSVSIPDFTFQPLPTSTLPPSTIHPSALDFCVEVPQIFDAGTTLTRDDAAMGEEIHFSPAEPAPFTGIDFSAYPSGLGPEIVLNGPSSDVLLSIPDQENMFTVDFGSQAAVFALPLSGSVDGCVPDMFPQTHEGNSAILKEEDHGEMGQVNVDGASYALGAPSSDEQLEHSVEAFALGYAPFDEQPRLESDISVLTAAEAGADTRTESSVQEVAISQAQPSLEQSQPVDCAPLPSVELEVALLPTTVPTPPPTEPQEEIVHPIVEECTGELPHIESAPNLVGEQEAEDKTSAADVPVPPSTPPIRRRSGGPRDRIAFPHEKRTYYGPRPSSAQWQAYLRAGSPRVERPPSTSTNKSSSSLSSSPALRLPAHPERLWSTSADATPIAEPAYPCLPSRGRSRRRPSVPHATDRPKSKKSIVTPAAETDISAATVKTRKTKVGGNRKEETHASSSSIPTSHAPRVPPPDSLSPPQELSLPSWAKPPCCPNFSRTGQKPCIHALRASGQLAGTRWESESSDSELEEEKDALSSAEQGWSAGYLAKLSLAAGALYFLESVVF